MKSSLSAKHQENAKKSWVALSFSLIVKFRLRGVQLFLIHVTSSANSFYGSVPDIFTHYFVFILRIGICEKIRRSNFEALR